MPTTTSTAMKPTISASPISSQRRSASSATPWLWPVAALVAALVAVAVAVIVLGVFVDLLRHLAPPGPACRR